MSRQIIIIGNAIKDPGALGRFIKCGHNEVVIVIALFKALF